MSAKIVINIWSDIICPYCRLGKFRLEKALAASSMKDRYQLVHKAFRLAPGHSVQQVEKALSEKMNASEEEVSKMQRNLEAIAAEEGLHYDLKGTLYGDTTEAHRLVLWAAEKNKQPELLDCFFQGYFAEHANIFEREILLNLAESIGLNREEAKEVLKSDRFIQNVEADEEEAHGYGVRGVPFFIFAGKYAVSGAQQVNAFVNVIEKISSEFN
jgi:predicted DsbA family dithiol-disulfide isomerase